MAYIRHDINGDPAPAPEPYERNDINCNPTVPQPSYTEATDSYGNTYRNYNADYVSN